MGAPLIFPLVSIYGATPNVCDTNEVTYGTHVFSPVTFREMDRNRPATKFDRPAGYENQSFQMNGGTENHARVIFLMVLLGIKTIRVKSIPHTGD